MAGGGVFRRWLGNYKRELVWSVGFATAGNVGQLLATWAIQGTLPTWMDAFRGEPFNALALHIYVGLGIGLGIWMFIAAVGDRDRAKQKKLEEAYGAVRRESALKTRFLLETSHEFINPLAIAQGYAGLLTEGREWDHLTQGQQKAARTVVENLERLNGLLRDTLHVAEKQAITEMAMTGPGAPGAPDMSADGAPPDVKSGPRGAADHA